MAHQVLSLVGSGGGAPGAEAGSGEASGESSGAADDTEAVPNFAPVAEDTQVCICRSGSFV